MIDVFFLINLCFSVTPVILATISAIKERHIKKETPTITLRTAYLALLGSLFSLATLFLADTSSFPLPLSVPQMISLGLLIGSWIILLTISNLPNIKIYGEAVAKWMRRNMIILFALTFIIGALLRAVVEYVIPVLLGAYTGLHYSEYIWDRGQYYMILVVTVGILSLLLHYLFKRPLKTAGFRKKHNLTEPQTNNLLLLYEVVIFYVMVMLLGGSYLTIPLITFLYILHLTQKLYERKQGSSSEVAGEDRFFTVITAVEKYPKGQGLFRIGITSLIFVALLFPFLYPIVEMAPFQPSIGLLIFLLGSILLGIGTWVLIYFTTNSMWAVRLIVISISLLFLIPIFDWWMNPLYIYVQGTFFAGDYMSNIVSLAWLYFTMAIFIVEIIHYWITIEKKERK